VIDFVLEIIIVLLQYKKIKGDYKMKFKFLSMAFAGVLSLALFAGCGTTATITNDQAMTAIDAVVTELTPTQGSLAVSNNTNGNGMTSYDEITTTNEYTEATQMKNMLAICSKLMEQNKLNQGETFTQYNLTISDETMPVRFRIYYANGYVYADAILADDFATPTSYQIISAKIQYDYANTAMNSFEANYVYKLSGETTDSYVGNAYQNQHKYTYSNSKDTNGAHKNAAVTQCKNMLGTNATVTTEDISTIHDAIVNPD